MKNFYNNLKNLKNLMWIVRHLDNLDMSKNICSVASCTAEGMESSRVLSRMVSFRSRFALVALLMVMGSVNVCGAEIYAYAWPNTTISDKGKSMKKDASLNCGVYVSMWGGTPSGEGDYYQYDYARRSFVGSTRTAKFCATSRTGYRFIGWYTNAGYSAFLTSANPYTVDVTNSQSLTLYAKFAKIYYVKFNGNGSNGGTAMENQRFDYDGASQALTANTYTKTYTVSYNPRGGSYSAALTSANTASSYTFAGWATSSVGSKVYDDEEAVQNLTQTANGVFDLYATWSGGAVTLPTPSKADSTFAGWYNGSLDDPDNLVGYGGQPFSPTSNVELKAKWTKVKQPVFTGEGMTLRVGETYSGFVFANTSTDSPSSSSSDKFYYVLTTTASPTGITNGNQVISFDGTTVTALNNGVATIKFYQKPDGDIIQGESGVYTFTVSRNDPVFTLATADHYYYNTSIVPFVTKTAGLDYTVESNNEQVVSVEGNNISIYNKQGTANIRIHHPETYMWAEYDSTVVVAPEKASNHVEFTMNSAALRDVLFEGKSTNSTSTISCDDDGKIVLTQGGAAWDANELYYIIHFTGIPDSISFKYRTTQNLATSYGRGDAFVVYESDSGENDTWHEVWRAEVPGDSDDHNVNPQPLRPNTRFLKFFFHATYTGNYKNIRVTELKRFKTDSTSFDFKTNLKNANVPSKSFEFKHANAGYTVKAELSDSTHYQISLDNLSFSGSVIIPNTGGDRMDSSVVYVKYYPSATGDAEETHNATITFSDQLSNSAIVTLTGKTQAKLSTHLVYKGSASYSVDAANIAATDLFEVRDANNALVSNPTITLSAAANEIFDLANSNTELDPKCGGSATITASYVGDVTHEAASDLAQVITINRLDDEVSFEHGKAVLVTGDEFDLEGWASALSGTDITYTTASTTVIRVEDGKVKAIGKGSATLTATSAGDCTYNSGIAKLTIKVRDASDPCETALLYKSSKHNINLYSGTQTYTIKEGPQDKLTFKVWKTSSVATYSADVKILDNTDNVLHTYTYSVGDLSTTEPETPNVEIDITQYPTARKISISGSGTLYKYISELRVSQKAYLTASTSSVTMSTVKACETATGQFNISYSDLSTLHLTQSDDNFTYEVWNGETKLDGFDNDCGDYGTYTVKFFYTPQVVGPYSNEVTISASGKSQTIVLNGTANKPDRTIVWDILSGNVISATQSVDLAAYAETSCLSPAGGVYYTYSSATEGAATIDGSKITFHKAATVTVTAHTVSSDDYNDAATVDKVWTVSKVGIVMEKKPTITSIITCGDLSTAVTYNSNDFKAVSALDNTVVVPGSIAYALPASFDHAGLTDITFNFTPTDLSVYEATPFTVQVDVQHIASNATPSAEAITYGAAISSSTLSNSGTTAGTWTWNTENNDAVLDAGNHTLNVHFTPENSNYSELDATVTLKVNKAPTSLNWTNAPEDLAYNATGVTYTASSASDGAITYSIIAGGAYASIDGNGVLTIIEPGHTITIQASQAAGTNHTAPVAITVDVTIAAAPSAPTFNNVAGDNDWQNADNWSNGEVPSGENPDVIISGELIINEDVTVGGLTILSTGSVAVVTNGTLTIKGTSETRSEYGDMHVADDGNVVLGNSADLKVRHFFLDAKLGDSSTQAASGQVKGNGALNVIGDAYFQMKFDPSGAITYGWYDFVVPFEVNTNGGIYRVEANDDLTPMTSGVDFLVQSFSEARCAAGQKAWTNFSGTMMPGQGYTITFNYQPSFNQNTFLFKKKAGATIGGSNTYSAVRTFSGEESEQGWNVLGNGTLQHIELAENLKIQIFEHASNSYQPFVATEKTIAVGTSFQVQVFDAQKTIVMSTATDRPILAPKREVCEVEEFRLSLTAEGEEKEADRLWISASEEATGAYWIGHDLLKKGTMTGAKVARMWCTRNGKQLCDVEMPMVNGSAENALGLFTPNAGQYTLAIEEAPADASLYLTYNGAIIWDLTASPYVFDLTKGTTEGYGLRIEAANAPQVTTGVENGGLMNDANSVRKVIIDNKMYIITPEGAIFDVIGKKVQ